MADGLERGLANLADALRNRIGHREYLVRLLIQEQVVIAKVWAAHMPVKVLGLQVKRKHVRQGGVQCSGDILGRIPFQIRGSCQRSRLPALEILGLQYGFVHVVILVVS